MSHLDYCRHMLTGLTASILGLYNSPPKQQMFTTLEPKSDPDNLVLKTFLLLLTALEVKCNLLTVD